MLVVRLETPSVAAAEEAIARVWRMLEAHHIATPRMTMTHGSAVRIELSFTSPADAKRVAEALRSAALAASMQ